MPEASTRPGSAGPTAPTGPHDITSEGNSLALRSTRANAGKPLNQTPVDRMLPDSIDAEGLNDGGSQQVKGKTPEYTEVDGGHDQHLFDAPESCMEGDKTPQTTRQCVFVDSVLVG